MKKPKRKRTVIVIAVILLFIAAYLVYSRPLTIQQRYPMLNLDKCTELRGYFRLDGQEELTEFIIDKNSKEFEILYDLLCEQDYCRSLRDLLPRGTRIHPTEPGSFQWEVSFLFEDIVFPDGSIGSGGILSIQSWYGELDIHFDGDVLSCYTSEQQTWAKEVLNAIQ